jgi:catechol 2,3-dioxygenase-like lactoylglutathione lyase family enzyme
MLGRFLEFTVATPDILESLNFYKQLGFDELESSDIWPHKFAVVSDGELCIGLHARDFQSPALTFVHQEVAREARSMSDHGFDFTYLQIDEDSFNELGFVDRDGHLITLIEARTFSRPDDDLDKSLCGRWIETTLPVKDALRAGRFWAPLAPELLRMREEPTTHMRFNAAGMSLGLSESIALDGPSLCFRCDDREEVWIALAKHGFTHKEFPGFEGAFMSVTAPEGTTLYLFDEDFLGELYEVDEQAAT